jgi:hypothetical protein
LEALVGDTVAESVEELPTVNANVLLERETPVTPTVTVTVHDAVFTPSLVFTVMVAVPAPTAVTLPELSTLATLELKLVQVTFLFVALEGETVADRDEELPTVNANVFLERETPVTATTLFATETVHEAVLAPSAVFTVIVAVPAPIAVTLPALLTVATLVLELVQVTFLFVALEGVTVAVNVSELPITKVIVFLDKVMPVTGTVTVTVHAAVLEPSAVLTVMAAVPAPIAVTLPVLSTVATLVLELVQVTFLFVALEGAIVALSISELPTLKASALLDRETPVTGTVTVTVQEAVLDPSSVLTVIVAVPAPIAVTFPALLTVATFVLELVQVIFLFVALDGATVALSVSELPTLKASALLDGETPVTGTVTVTVQEAVLDPSVVLTVMVAVPAPIAVTFPALSTVATLVLELVQATVLSAALDGETVAVNVELLPTVIAKAVLDRVTPVTATMTVTVHWSV